MRVYICGIINEIIVHQQQTEVTKKIIFGSVYKANIRTLWTEQCSNHTVKPSWLHHQLSSSLAVSFCHSCPRWCKMMSDSTKRTKCISVFQNLHLQEIRRSALRTENHSVPNSIVRFLLRAGTFSTQVWSSSLCFLFIACVISRAMHSVRAALLLKRLIDAPSSFVYCVKFRTRPLMQIRGL